MLNTYAGLLRLRPRVGKTLFCVLFRPVAEAVCNFSCSKFVARGRLPFQPFWGFERPIA